MADLTNTVRWVPYVPDLLGNRALERPFYFELNGSMSKEQIRALLDELKKPLPVMDELPSAATPEQLAAQEEQARQRTVKRQAEVLGPFIRFGPEALTIQGKPVTTLADYFDAVTLPPLERFDALFELSQALGDTNSLGARVSFSSGRLSGGFTSTTRRNSASGRGQTVAH